MNDDALGGAGGGDMVGKVNVVYKRRYVSSRVGLNTLDGTEADADVTLAYEGISFGVTTGYRFGEGKLLAKRATLCYTDGEESEVSVSICDQPRSVKVRRTLNVTRAEDLLAAVHRATVVPIFFFL